MTSRKGDAERLPESDYTVGVCPRATRMTQTLSLGVATVLVAIGSFLASVHHNYTAYGFFIGAIVMVGFAMLAARIESIPKPHLVPVGYGKTGDASHKGLLFVNDGEPAYNLEAPTETSIGSATLIFDDPRLPRLSRDGGMQCFPMAIRDSDGRTYYNDLRGKIVLRDINRVLFSFRYADSKKPTVLRYTTTCRVEPTKKDIEIYLESVRFAWWKF